MTLKSTATAVAATASKNIQLPKQMSYNNGESIMKKSSGLMKVRKGQSEEEYNVQKEEFWASGPVVQTASYVTDILTKYSEMEDKDKVPLSEADKILRERVIHGLERLYFQRDYTRCLNSVDDIISNLKLDGVDLNAKKNKNLKRIVNELHFISNRCIDKIQTQNQKDLASI